MLLVLALLCVEYLYRDKLFENDSHILGTLDYIIGNIIKLDITIAWLEALG